MQFAAILALAASASAMVVQRQNETVATVEVYNFSTCDVDAASSYDFATDSDCINFDAGYGSASFEPATDSNEWLRKSSSPLLSSSPSLSFPHTCTHLSTKTKQDELTIHVVAVFTEKDCAGAVKVTGPTGCADNTSGEAIWSAGLVKNPAAKRA